MNIEDLATTLVTLINQKFVEINQRLDDLANVQENADKTSCCNDICSLKYTLPKVCEATEPTDPGGVVETPDISGWEEAVINDLEITNDGDVSDYTPKFR